MEEKKYTKEEIELALRAKRRAYGSSQLEGNARELFVEKKPFELEKMLEEV